MQNSFVVESEAISHSKYICCTCLDKQQAARYQLTTDAQISNFQIHFKTREAWFDVVEVLVVDA